MQETGITCPHCHEELHEDQLKKLWAEYCGSKTSAAKARAAAVNGKKGGRPVTYFQNVYDAIPHSIDLVRSKLQEQKQKHLFNVEVMQSDNPVENGFYLKCDNILWHVRWNPANSHVEAFKNGRQVTGYNNVNNSAKTSALRLVEDIHRAKLMDMPEDYSDLDTWLKQLRRS